MHKTKKEITRIYTAILRSGKTNSSIMDDNNLILVDCGVGPRILEEKLQDIKKSICDLTGAVITHSHSDHMNKATVRKLDSEGIPVYCHNQVKKILLQIIKKHSIHGVEVNEKFRIGDYKIKPFVLEHDDAGGCTGYVFRRSTNRGIKKIVYATDFGYPSENVKEF